MFDQFLFFILALLFFHFARVSYARLQYAQMMYLGHPTSRWEVLFNTLLMSSAALAIGSSAKFVILSSRPHTLSLWFFIYVLFTLAFAYGIRISTKALLERLDELNGQPSGYDEFAGKAFLMIIIFVLMFGLFASSAWDELQVALI